MVHRNTFLKNVFSISLFLIFFLGIDFNMNSQTEILFNNSFDDALANWEVWGGTNGTAELDDTSILEGTNSAKITLTGGGGESWEFGFAQSISGGLISGKTYTVKYTAVANTDITVDQVIQEVNSPWSNYYTSTLSVGTSPQTFEENFVADVTGECNFVFQLGAIGTGNIVWLDDIHLIELAGSNVNDIQNSAITLSQNVPNPAKSVTTINFRLEKPDFVNISIFDISGKKVIDAVNNNFSTGNNSVDINVENLKSGIYFYTLKTSDLSKTMKMNIIR